MKLKDETLNWYSVKHKRKRVICILFVILDIVSTNGKQRDKNFIFLNDRTNHLKIPEYVKQDHLQNYKMQQCWPRVMTSQILTKVNYLLELYSRSPKSNVTILSNPI